MFGLSADELGAARAVLQGFVYRRATDLVGRRFEVASLGALLHAAALLPRHGLEGELTQSKEMLADVLAQHGVADLEFALTRVPSPVGRPRLAELRRLLGQRESLRRDGRLLRAVAADVASKQLFLKMFLTASDEASSVRTFPRTFVCTDACITNCRMLWLNAHLYLGDARQSRY